MTVPNPNCPFPAWTSFAHNRGLRHDEQIRSATALSLVHMQEEIARLFALMQETSDSGDVDLADINACATGVWNGADHFQMAFILPESCYTLLR